MSISDRAPITGDFDAIAFAGGGNRCYWQGGFWDALGAGRPQSPRSIVGVSAGAFQACFSVIGRGAQVRKLVIDACATNKTGLEWQRLARGRSPFVVGGLYRDLLTEIFDASALADLRSAPEVLIQLAHPPRWLPGSIAALPAIGAYQIEKLLTGAAHSKAGRYLGFNASWVSTHQVADCAALVDALMATASVPPFMPVGRIGGLAALDGGLVDNPPLQKLEVIERAGGRTLVLSTRSGRTLSAVDGRTIVRPSRPIGISKFSVTDAEGIHSVYELGLQDGARFADELARQNLSAAPT